MASSHILQIFLRVIIQDQIRISQRVSSSTQPVSMLNLQILSSYFMCDFRDMVFFLIRFRTHSRRERAGIIISEENKKSEPFSYREKVRIFIVWCIELLMASKMVRSAGSHGTESMSSFVSHRAASASFRTRSPETTSHQKQSMER